MIVRCPQCATRYRLSAEQLAGRSRVRLRCTECGTRFAPDVASGRLDRATGAVDAVITGSVSAVPDVTAAALPRFGGAGRPLEESGALPAVGAEVPRAAMPPRATGVLPARPTLVGGAVAAAGPGLPRFGSGEMQSVAAPGPATGGASGALPAFGGSAAAQGSPAALPRFGNASAPASTEAPPAPAAAPAPGPAAAAPGPVLRPSTGALPAFGGGAPVARVVPVPAPAQPLPTFGAAAGGTAALPALGAAVPPRSATGALPAFGGARIAAPGQELPSSLPPRPAAIEQPRQPAGRPSEPAAAPQPPVQAAWEPDGEPSYTEPDIPTAAFQRSSADELFDMAGARGVFDDDGPDAPHVVGAHVAPEPERGGNVDPIMAFQDVYREVGVRRGDADLRRFIEAAREGETDGSALVEPQPGFGFTGPDPTPSRSTEPPLAPLPPAPVTEESALLDLALLASGISEPAPPPAPPDPEAIERERVIGLDVAGDAARRDALLQSARPNVWLSTATAVLAALLALLGILAWRNDGIIDFRELDQMVNVAFRDATYVPRHVTVVRVRETAEGPVEELVGAEALHGVHALEIADVTTSRYTTRSGLPVVVVAGAATNRTADALRGVEIRAAVLDEAGAAVASRVIPAGSEIHEAEIEQIDALGVDALDATVRERASGVLLEPGQQTRFAAVFVVPPSLLEQPLRWEASPESALRPCAQDCWARIRFARAEVAPSAGTTPP